VELARKLELPRKGVRSVFPEARRRYHRITGAAVPAWFDQDACDLLEADPQSLDEAVDEVSRLLAREAEIIDHRQIFLCGFSQGAALALIVGLRQEKSLGGLALYAPYLVRQGKLRETRSACGVETPLWIGQGRDDLVVPMSFSERIRTVLQQGGYSVKLTLYAGGHKAFHGVEAGDLDEFFLIDRVI
jgi:phospholipase/carboxylesterase